MITVWVEAAGLTLHPTKTKIVGSCVESFAFPGYSFRGEKINPRRESLAKMKAGITELTPRKRPGSMPAEIGSCPRRVSGTPDAWQAGCCVVKLIRFR